MSNPKVKVITKKSHEALYVQLDGGSVHVAARQTNLVTNETQVVTIKVQDLDGLIEFLQEAKKELGG